MNGHFARFTSIQHTSNGTPYVEVNYYRTGRIDVVLGGTTIHKLTTEEYLYFRKAF